MLISVDINENEFKGNVKKQIIPAKEKLKEAKSFQPH